MTTAIGGGFLSLNKMAQVKVACHPWQALRKWFLQHITRLYMLRRSSGSGYSFASVLSYTFCITVPALAFWIFARIASGFFAHLKLRPDAFHVLI
jgi:hypothetical protein